MEHLTQFFDSVLSMTYLIVPAIFAGSIGFANRVRKDGEDKKVIFRLCQYVLNVCQSIIGAYVVYLGIDYFIDGEASKKLAMAGALLAAYMGADVLTNLQDIFLNKLKSYKGAKDE